MWYLFRCSREKEEELLRKCREKLDSSILEDAFLFTYDRLRRYEGSWHSEKVSMFPGFICLQSSDGQALSGELARKVFLPGVSVQDPDLVPVRWEEQRFLSGLGGEAHHIPFSRGVIRHGKTFVLEGPLKGREEMITRIDRHKRLAYLRTSHLPQALCVKAGLEITEKAV